MPWTKRNIDHVVIGPAGVFVVDAKNHKGSIAVRDRGGFFRTDLKLYVGGRDCSRLAGALGWQVEAVQTALSSTPIDPLPSVTPVLCFIAAEFPLIRKLNEFAGVRLESINSLKKLVQAPVVLDPEAVEAIAAVIAAALPPK